MISFATLMLSSALGAKKLLFRHVTEFARALDESGAFDDNICELEAVVVSAWGFSGLMTTGVSFGGG